MDKKLPGIFANKIDKKITNNEKIYYAKHDEKLSTERENKEVNTIINPNNNLNINQKINQIFNSSKYVYKADVRITLNSDYIDCRIIGRNSTHLITMDNKLIPISDITDISFLEK